MRMLRGIIVVSALVAPAAADVSVDLKAKDPVAGLPAVSGDDQNFLRPFRIWKKGCKKAEIQVEFGAIDPEDIEPSYTTMPLVGGCGEAKDAYKQNVSAINESLRDTQCRSAPVRGKSKVAVPASFDADELHVAVTTTPATVNFQINALDRTVGAWTGGRRVELANVTEVHGWYLVDQGKARQIAILVSVAQADGTIAEQWKEVWLHEVAAKPKAEDVARTWLLALAQNDATVLADVTAGAFERGGLETGEAACKKTRIAKKQEQKAGVLECALGVSSRYAALYDEVEFEKIKVKEIPRVLKAQKKKLTKLAKKHTLVQFHVEQDGWDATIVFAVNKSGKVAAAFEAIKPL